MRIIPPKTKKTQFTYKEFKEHLFNHKVVGCGKPLTFLDFLDMCLNKYKNEDEAIDTIISMLPLSYQYISSDILYEYLDEKVGR